VTAFDVTCSRFSQAGRRKRSATKIFKRTFVSLRCFEVSSQNPVVSLLRDLVPAIEKHGLRWFLFGAQAAILWGNVRSTNDVDITVIEPADREAFVNAMREHGFDLKYSDRESMTNSRVFPFNHRATGIKLDVVIGGHPLEETFVDRAVDVDIEGIQIPVISPEDLIVVKILAERPKDIEDVRSVIVRQRKSLDTAHIRETLAILEEALTRSDLLPLFEREWNRDL